MPPNAVVAQESIQPNQQNQYYDVAVRALREVGFTKLYGGDDFAVSDDAILIYVEQSISKDQLDQGGWPPFVHTLLGIMVGTFTKTHHLRRWGYIGNTNTLTISYGIKTLSNLSTQLVSLDTGGIQGQVGIVADGHLMGFGRQGVAEHIDDMKFIVGTSNHIETEVPPDGVFSRSLDQ